MPLEVRINPAALIQNPKSLAAFNPQIFARLLSEAKSPGGVVRNRPRSAPSPIQSETWRDVKTHSRSFRFFQTDAGEVMSGQSTVAVILNEPQALAA
jgi:hypothetical protein